MFKDLALSLSLSNLCFITSWRLLLTPSTFLIYHQKIPRPPVDYLALILDVLLLATLFFAGITLTRRSQNRWMRKGRKAAFILILVVPLYALLMQVDSAGVRQFMLSLMSDELVVRKILASVPLTACLFFLFIALFRTDKTIRVAIRTTLILTPFALVTFSQAALTALKSPPGEQGASPMVRKSASPNSRVLWLIFDELDFRMAFLERPPTVQLPELDRLISQSLVAQNAYPPAGETFLTMPALITGKLVSEARRSGPDELLIKFGDNTEAVHWGAQPNIFSRAGEAGFNTALVGWYHPYCRILGSNLTKCAWEGTVQSTGLQGLVPRMHAHALRTALVPPLATLVFPQRTEVGDLVRKKHASDFNSIYQQAVEAATDPNLGLVMVHWPIPHPPTIYDRSADQISVAPGHSYLDNLELADRTLGEIRRAMESNGTWDNTAVLVTSDHWWRTDYWKKGEAWTAEESALAGAIDRRVPFILKMAGVGQARTDFAAQFNTILTHDLLLSILRGEVSDTKGAAAWLERHRSIGRSPYDERNSRDAL